MLAEPDRSFFVDLEGMRLRVWGWGDEDAPPILALHGAFDHGRMWDELAPRIAALGFSVFAIDQRGHGVSGRIETGQMFRPATIDLGRLMRHLGQPVGIIGHSMGSSIMFGAAATWPERVRWVVSIDGLGPPKMIFDDVPYTQLTTGMFDYAVKTFGRGKRVFATKADMAAQRGAINHRVPGHWLSHLVEHGSEPNGDGWSWKWDPTFNVNMPEGFRLELIEAELRSMTRPALVFTGGEDDMWSEMSEAEVAHRMGLFADARHFSVPGGGHYLHLERPDFVIDRLTEFLTEMGEQ